MAEKGFLMYNKSNENVFMKTNQYKMFYKNKNIRRGELNGKICDIGRSG